MRPKSQSHNLRDGINDQLNLREDSLQQRTVGSSIGVESSVSLTRFMWKGNVQSDFAFFIKFDAGVRRRQFEEKHYSPVVEVPLVDIKRCLLSRRTLAYELYVVRPKCGHH